MLIVATVFLELWRRKQNVIQWEWDLQGTEQDEEPRPGKEKNIMDTYALHVLLFVVYFRI